MPELLTLSGVSKSFPGVQALRDVSLTLYAGQIHAVVGENGAGKSTLMKVLAGVHHPDAGEILWEGTRLHLHGPADADKQGISIIHQELNLIPHLTVAENVLLNREPTNRFGLVAWGQMRRRARALLQDLGTDIDVNAEVRLLGVAQQQMVEIARALSKEARLIIMDEPTASLNRTEVDLLFRAARALRSRGKTVVFISHRLDEVLEISDVISVMKDGELVETRPRSEFTKAAMVNLMIGRSLDDTFASGEAAPSATPLLAISELSGPRLVGVTLTLHSGEILGVTGLEGQGQTNLARALFGDEPVTAGRITLNGEPITITSPPQAIAAGLGFVTDDRKGEGLAPDLSIRENVALPNLDAFSVLGVMFSSREHRAVGAIVTRLRVSAPTIERAMSTLSGGNQQKVVLAKWLLRQPKVLVFIEPTRGIDVGAKVDLYHLIRGLAGAGAGILMVSSDLLELVGMADRVLVMRGGRIVTELSGGAINEANIIAATTGLVTGQGSVDTVD